VLSFATIVLDLANRAVRTPDLLAPFRDALNDKPITDPARLIVALAIALLVPGAIALVLCWRAVRRLLREGGVAAELAALHARPPRAADLEEHQLVNVVEEIAIAAGLPPPGVYLIDSGVANAAVVGSSHSDAAVVVSTGLLAVLGRDETQGVIAHLMGRIGNGDLRIARTIGALYDTLGLVSGVLTAPTDRTTRAAIRPVLGLALRPGTARKDPERAARASAALLSVQAGDSHDRTSGDEPGCLSVLLLPVLAAQLAFVMNQLILSLLVVNPFLRRAWRARMELADATAVELTRYPDGLAQGLVDLARRGGTIPGTEPLGHLFVVGSGTSGGSGSTTKSPLAGFQPRLAKRVKELDRLGASVSVADTRRRLGFVGKLLLVLIGGPFIVLFFALMLGICVALTGIAFALYMLFLVGPVLVIHAALRGTA
jgi:Zn-dependent protease with chaperone function